MNQTCFKWTIVTRSKTDAGHDEALMEAVARMLDGNVSGKDLNKDGAFYFERQDISDQPKEWPA